MSIFQSDAVIRESISLAIEDTRKNIWLLDYIFQDFTSNPYLQEKFGQKQIDAAKEYLLNNQIDVGLGYIADRSRLPAITILLEPQQEKQDMKHMGDDSTESVVLLPTQIGKPIPYIVKPFTPDSYDESAGELLIPAGTVGADSVSVGMIVVDPATGNGYPIVDVIPNGVSVAAGTEIKATKLGILPQNQYYVARVEHVFMDAKFTVLVTAHGDPQNVLWLHDIVLAGLYRYKQSLLEALGLSETVISSGPLSINQEFSTPGGETVWDRAITINGQIEQTFIKSPSRIIETVALKEKASNSKGFVGGIQILSNSEPLTTEQEADELWYPIEDNE